MKKSTKMNKTKNKVPILDGWYYEGSYDNLQWVQLTPLIPYDLTSISNIWNDIKYQFPYLKVIDLANGEKIRETFIQNDFYWAFKHGYICPHCHQFVFGPVEPKEEINELDTTLQDIKEN